jgi:hypothetical protein
VRNDVVVLGFDDEHVALEGGAGLEGAIVLRLHGSAAIGCEAVFLQLDLGQRPVLILVEGGHAKGEPAYRPERAQDRGEIAAIAAADDQHAIRIDAGLGGEGVVGGEHVPQAVLARDRFLLPLGVAMAA